MPKERCPGCGAQYNGKKCRTCGFQKFSAGGKRDVLTERQKLPMERTSAPETSTCRKQRKSRKQKPGIHSLIGLLIIFLLIALLLPMLRNWGARLEEMEAASAYIGQTVSD